MSNDEYQQQDYWKEEDPYEQLAKAFYKMYQVMYDTGRYKTALSYLTDNQIEYKWNIDSNYGKKVK